MNAEGHKKKVEEIEGSLNKLLPDPKGENVVAIVELVYGIIQHLISYGMEKKYGRHLDTHVGMPKQLRDVGNDNIAIAFETIDTYRAGRWYGGKGNGDIVRKSLQLKKKVKRWASKNDI